MMGFRHWRKAIEQMPSTRRPVYVATESLAQSPTAAGPAYNPDIDDALSPLAKGFGNTMPEGLLETFRNDIQNGTLPSVSRIIPPSQYSEHPGPSSPAQGGWYVQQIPDALTANPEIWSQTVLLVNYDENDGFFDHLLRRARRRAIRMARSRAAARCRTAIWRPSTTRTRPPRASSRRQTAARMARVRACRCS